MFQTLQCGTRVLACSSAIFPRRQLLLNNEFFNLTSKHARSEMFETMIIPVQCKILIDEITGRVNHPFLKRRYMYFPFPFFKNNPATDVQSLQLPIPSRRSPFPSSLKERKSFPLRLTLENWPIVSYPPRNLRRFVIHAIALDKDRKMYKRTKTKRFLVLFERRQNGWTNPPLLNRVFPNLTVSIFVILFEKTA